jgi:hypothetical protein
MKRFVLGGLLALTGCSTTMAQLRQDVAPSASKYLECPEDKLTIEELQRLVMTTRVKVTGCGRSEVYVLEESKWKRVTH